MKPRGPRRIWHWFAIALPAIACGCAEEPAGPGSTDVHGTVLRELGGDPAAGVVVIVSGKSPVTTGSEGSFHIPEVGPVYDLTVVYSSWADEKHVRVYVGLTRRHLMIEVPPLEPVPHLTARISGLVPESPERVTRLFFSGFSAPAGASTSSFLGQYSLTISWFSTLTSLTGRLYVLRWIEGPNGHASQFDGFAARDLTLTPGAHVAGVNFSERNLSDPPDRHISGATTAPSGYSLDGRGLAFEQGPFYFGLVEEYRLIRDDFDYVVPELPGVTFQLGAAAQSPTGRSGYSEHEIPAGAIGIGARLRAAPALLSPPDGASEVDTSTLFEWEAREKGVDVLHAWPDTLGAGPRIEIYLQDSSARLPELPEYAELPAGTAYLWQIFRRSYPTSVDALVSPLPSDVSVHEFWSAWSEAYTFTTGSAVSGRGLVGLRPAPLQENGSHTPATRPPSAASRAR